jgi:hypothetical protein
MVLEAIKKTAVVDQKVAVTSVKVEEPIKAVRVERDASQQRETWSKVEDSLSQSSGDSSHLGETFSPTSEMDRDRVSRKQLRFRRSDIGTNSTSRRSSIRMPRTIDATAKRRVGAAMQCIGYGGQKSDRRTKSQDLSGDASRRRELLSSTGERR